MEFLTENNLPLLIHTGLSPTFTNAQNVLEVAAAYPQVRILIAHLAAFDTDILNEINNSPNLFTDCTPFLTLCTFAANRDTKHISANLFATNYTDPVQVLIDLDKALPGKVVWGTDAPWTSVISSNKNSNTLFDYEDECRVLTELANRGHVLTKQNLTTLNTSDFLFGKC